MLGQLGGGELGGEAEGDRARGILGSGPSALLIAAVQERLDSGRPRDEQRSDADRSADLVGGDRERLAAPEARKSIGSEP